MARKRIFFTLSLLLALLLLSACTSPPAEEAPPPTPEPETIEVTRIVEGTPEVVEVTRVVESQVEVVVTPTPEEVEPVKVCGSAPLTGQFAEPGNATREGYELWADVVNEKGGLLGRPVEMILVDDGSDPDTAVANYERLITEEECELLVGEFSSALTFPTSAVAERFGMLYITPAGGVPDIYERGFEGIFMAAPSGPVRQVRPYFDWLDSLPDDQRPETLAVINDDDFFANFIAQGAEQFAAEMGFEVVNQQTFPVETTDYTPIVESMRADGADAVVMGTANAQSAIGVMRGMEQLEYHPVSVFQSTGPDQPEYREALGSISDGVVTSVGFTFDADWPGLDEFVQAFQEKYDGRTPFEDNATAYSVGQVLEYAVNTAQSFDNEELADVLHTPGLSVMTVQGPIEWAPTGAPIGDSNLLQWQDGELQLIWPTGVATAEYLWPMPWE